MRIENLSTSVLRNWLEEEDETRLEQLWYMANRVRAQHVGEAVHLRALCEIGNFCARACTYCGLSKRDGTVERYRLSEAEICQVAAEAQAHGYGTLVLQGGEDPNLDLEMLARCVRYASSKLGLAVTLSLGELPVEALVDLHRAGARRYLLRFETSNPQVFARIHPACGCGTSWESRVGLLPTLRKIGFEVGSGVMVGIPGTTIDDLVRDLNLFKELSLDMVGLGPYLPAIGTPLALEDQWPSKQKEMLTYKMLALTRMLLPLANIPATTALATLNPLDGRALGLRRGANVIMPNLTPSYYRQRYQLYPNKARESQDTARESTEKVHALIAEVGRTVGVGAGFAPSFLQRKPQ